MIVLNDDIGIKTVQNFYFSLKEELEKNEEIIVDFTNVKRVDLSILQAIIAAGRLARSQDKVIKLKQASDDVKHQLSLCGLKT